MLQAFAQKRSPVDSPRKQTMRRLLGEMLMDAGLISKEKLEQALREHRRTGMRLGEFLVHNNLVDESDLVQVISHQLRLHTYDPKLYPVGPHLRPLLKEEVAREQNCVPLKDDGNVLWVACLDPTDMVGLDSVTETTRLDVEPVICTREQLQKIFLAIYETEMHGEAAENSLMDGLTEAELESVQAEADERDDKTLSLDAQAGMANQAPIVRLVNSILVQAMQRKASDVHIQAERDRVSLRLRVDGVLTEIAAPPKSVYLALVSRIKLLANMDISVSRIPQDGRFSFRTRDREVSVRANSLPTIHGEKLVLRILDQSARALTLEELGLSAPDREKIERCLAKTWGLLLATGPTGSGKTTMLYSLLRQVARPEINVVTLEDPVEYQMRGVAQVQLNRKAGMTFSSGLRSILRQDPDVIMVGEIRDKETAEIAIESALTGHKVLSTLHTNDAPGAVTRFAEMGVEPFLIASTLLLATAQRLLRRICPECARRAPATPEQLAVLGVRMRRVPDIAHAQGCRACSNTGYKGRLGIYEVLEVDAAVQAMILQGASSTEIKAACLKAGVLRTLRQDAALKVIDGKTSLEEFLRVGVS